MRDGYKIIDMDTHVGPPMEILEKYVEPSFRDRLSELDPYRRTFVRPDGVAATNLTAGAIPYDRFPGTAPTPDDETPVIGGRGALEGRTIKFHRAPTTPGVEEENVDGRIADMDREGRDVDFIFPSPWAATLTAVADQTLAQGMYRAYHRYMAEYSHKYPDRIKSSIQVNAADVEWAISEVNEMAKEKWASAVWVHLPAGTPVDHPKLEPLWAAMNEADLPLIHHSFFMEPPYFPGYRDIWGNAVVARTAAHPWGAERLCAYLIVSGLFDRYPNFRAATCEVGHGWLPNWLIRLDFHLQYVQGVTPTLKYTPLEYAQMGKFRCAAEAYEGPAMTKACVEILGTNTLMHQSDYPHGQCYYPETAKMVMEWDFWPQFGPDALRKHMYDNAADFLRLI